MIISNHGEIFFNKELVGDALDTVIAAFGINNKTENVRLSKDNKSLTFAEYYESDLDQVLDDLISEIEEEGYIANGSILYLGDYSGSYEVNNNDIVVFEDEEDEDGEE